MANRLHAYMAETIKNEGFGHAVRINSMPEHVHLLVQIQMTTSIADLLRVTKAASSAWINDTFALPRRFAWQTGYGAFSVAPADRRCVIDYIDGQQVHHGNVSFETEYLGLLDEHAIDYDERFVFD